MAQRQFASGDTSTWSDKFGSGVDGAGSINTSTFAEANETFTGTSGESTGTAGGTSIADNDLVLIHQTQGTGAGTDPNWELNKVVSGGGTANLVFKYPLTRTYSTGAQILKLRQYSSLTINTGQTLTGSTWNGSKGGIVAYLVNGIAQGPGTILLTGANGAVATGSEGQGGTGRGFKGGNGGYGQQDNAINGHTGDSIAGADTPGSNGGGGGSVIDADDNHAGGAGGGNGTAGANGTGVSGGGSNGVGGIAVGNAGLTIMTPGGGGGGSANHMANPAECINNGAGSGAGILLLIAKEIKNTLVITANGGEGIDDAAFGGNSGSGAGGSILLKGQIIALGSGLVLANGGTGGADGGVGRIHVDYLTSLTGTTTPTLDSTQDATLADAAVSTAAINFSQPGGFIEF